MPEIRHIALHHSGGLGNDKYASTAHLTISDINRAHKNRPDWVGYRAHESTLGYFGGYNICYDPKDRVFFQFRRYGEETLAQVGYNLNTISICIIGNYTRKPDGTSVDTLGLNTKLDVINFVLDLIMGRLRGCEKAPDTTLSLHPSRVYPHRWFQSTECYGTALADNYFRKEIEDRYYGDVLAGLRRLAIPVQLLEFIRQQFEKMKLGSGGRGLGCDGFIS